MKDIQPVQWIGGVDGCLRLIDQTRLPVEFVEIDCRSAESVWEAIKTLRVRGAPAIGIAAAYGVCLGVQSVLHADQGGFLASSMPRPPIWPPAGPRPSTCFGPWSG